MEAESNKLCPFYTHFICRNQHSSYFKSKLCEGVHMCDQVLFINSVSKWWSLLLKFAFIESSIKAVDKDERSIGLGLQGFPILCYFILFHIKKATFRNTILFYFLTSSSTVNEWMMHECRGQSTAAFCTYTVWWNYTMLTLLHCRYMYLIQVINIDLSRVISFLVCSVCDYILLLCW